jgi:hypothetical protein
MATLSLEGSMTKVVSKLLTRSKRFIKWVTLAILDLIAIASTAAVSGVVLQTSVQTHEFVA